MVPSTVWRSGWGPRVLRGIFLVLASAAGCNRELAECRELAGSAAGSALLDGCQTLFVDKGQPDLGETLAKAYDRLKDVPGLLAVGRTALARGQPGTVLDVADSLTSRGQFEEARLLASGALERAQADRDPRIEGRASYTLYHAAWTSSAYLDALRHVEGANRAAQASGDDGLRWRSRVALFEILYEIGSLDAAREAIDDAAANIGERGADGLRDVTFRRGVLEQEAGRRAPARKAYEETLLLNQRAKTPNKMLAWAARVNLLELALEAADRETAARELAATRELFEREQAHRPVAQAAFAYEQARFHALVGETSQALAAIDQAEAAKPPAEIGWRLDLLRGEQHELLGDLDAAEQRYARAVLTIRRLAEQLNNDDLKSSVFLAKDRAFGRLFHLRLSRGRTVEALEVIEWARSRSLLDEFARSASSSPPDASARNGSRPADERAHFVERFIPRLRQRLSGRPAPPMGELLAGLGGKQVLVYVEHAPHAYLLDVHRGKVTAHRLVPSLQEIGRLVDAFTVDPDSRELAVRLGDALIPKKLDLASTVHVAPSSSLAPIPFAALRPGGIHLIERTALAYVPTVAGVLAAKPRDRGPRAAALVIADPKGDLPGSMAESIEVGKLLGASPLTGARAQTSVLRQAQSADVLHLSTHSGVSLRGPWFEMADGRMYGADVLEAPLRTNLVVLASCASAASRQPGLWGSLAATFLAAGARTVIGSLRTLEDQVARDLMVAFYRAGGAEAPLQALATVQRERARREPPSRWAYLVALGTESEDRKDVR